MKVSEPVEPSAVGGSQRRGLAFIAGISERHGTASGALAGVTAVAALITVGSAVAFGASAFDVFVGTATTAAPIILVAYLMLTLGALTVAGTAA